MNRERTVRYLAFITLALFAVAWAVSGWAGGPSAQDTVRFLDQKFKELGGGFAMVIDNEQGARYTRARRPVCLVYSEPASSRSEACRREWQIKQLKTAEKALLFSSSSRDDCSFEPK